MPKGNPNDSSKLLNFVAKIYDPKAQDWKPIYELPDSTDKVYGGVLLSDAIDDSQDVAATGVTAATPAAVAKVNIKTEQKLDKETLQAQTVKGEIAFESRVKGLKGFTGDLTGNATTATTLQKIRNISAQVGNDGNIGTSAFNGSTDVTITIPNVDGSHIVGTLPLSVLPKAALERIITVQNKQERLSLTKDQVQLGDTVYQNDTKIMYMVVDENKLNQEVGYLEYQAGTASRLGTASVGHDGQPFYLNAGIPTAMTSTIGANNQPVYVQNGTITPGTYTINKNVPADAKFTDTTYSVFNPATASAAGTSGLVPQPHAGEHTKFLRGDGTWQIAGEVTGVKGDKESIFRKGDVSLSAENVGALSLTGGIVSGGIAPNINNTLSLGSSTQKWANVYATTFNGTATKAKQADTASVANKVNKTIQLTGDITSNEVSLNTEGLSVINSSVANQSITNAKLANDVGTVYVGTNEPTQTNIRIWIEI